MDNTPIYLNMPTSTTVQAVVLMNLTLEHKKRKQKNNINYKIFASGEKLTPLLASKVKEGKDVEGKLQQIKCVK